MSSGSNGARRVTWSTVVGLAVGGLAFFAILLDFSTNLTRNAVTLGFASNFFDFQARALMDGHVWVPPDSLGIEGFIRAGRTYMYFPPLPAVLRIPVMLVTHDFDGRLTLVSMGLAWILFAAMTAKLFWLVRRCVRGLAPVTRIETVLAAVFLATATGGTVITFDASLPWAYHEVYLWAVALVVGGLYWMVRVALDPTPRAIAWLGVFNLAAILTRVTGGWALCLTTVGVATWFAFGRLDRSRRTVSRGVLTAGLAPLAVGIAYNYAKFHHPYLFPLQDQVWTRLNEHRREALQANGGTITGLQFFQTSLVNYFRPGGIRFVDYFPWITLPAIPARAYGGAFLDQSYRTGSVTGFMPLMLLLTAGSVPVLFRRKATVATKAVRPALVAGILVTAGVMAYGYLAYRYTSEFVPGLVVGGSVGVCALSGLLARRRRRFSWPATGLVAGLAVFGIVANMATGYATAAQTARGDQLVRYVDLQTRFADGAFTRLVSHSDGMPSGAGTDRLHIRGDCDGLYLNTGDSYEPWVVVQERDRVVQVTAGRRIRPGRVLLFRVHASRTRQVWLETNRTKQARVYLHNESGNYYGQWFDVPPDSPIRVGVRNMSELGHVEVTSTPGGFVGFLPSVEWDAQWNATPGGVEPVITSATTDRRSRLTLRPVPGLPLPLCQRVARAADVTLAYGD